MSTIPDTQARDRAMREYALAEEREAADDHAGANRARARARYRMKRAAAPETIPAEDPELS